MADGTAHRAVAHVVLDRDGVLNVEADDGWLTDLSSWRWAAGAEAGLDLLAEAGIVVSVATNQSGIGRGLVSAQEVAAIHRWLHDDLVRRGLAVAGIFCCPHAPGAACRCRKPAPGLILDAVGAAGRPASETWLIGDDLRDLDAGAAAGVGALLVRTGKGASVEAAAPTSVPVCDDLAAAAAWLLDLGNDPPAAGAAVDDVAPTVGADR